MRPLGSAVLDELLVLTGGIQQGISEDGQSAESSFRVDPFREPWDGPRTPAEDRGR
jgi:hypothetical protein